MLGKFLGARLATVSIGGADAGMGSKAKVFTGVHRYVARLSSPVTVFVALHSNGGSDDDEPNKKPKTEGAKPRTFDFDEKYWDIRREQLDRQAARKAARLGLPAPEKIPPAPEEKKKKTLRPDGMEIESLFTKEAGLPPSAMYLGKSTFSEWSLTPDREPTDHELWYSTNDSGSNPQPSTKPSTASRKPNEQAGWYRRKKAAEAAAAAKDNNASASIVSSLPPIGPVKERPPHTVAAKPSDQVGWFGKEKQAGAVDNGVSSPLLPPIKPRKKKEPGIIRRAVLYIGRVTGITWVLTIIRQVLLYVGRVIRRIWRLFVRAVRAIARFVGFVTNRPRFYWTVKGFFTWAIAIPAAYWRHFTGYGPNRARIPPGMSSYTYWFDNPTDSPLRLPPKEAVRQWVYSIVSFGFDQREWYFLWDTGDWKKLFSWRWYSVWILHSWRRLWRLIGMDVIFGAVASDILVATVSGLEHFCLWRFATIFIASWLVRRAWYWFRRWVVRKNVELWVKFLGPVFGLPYDVTLKQWTWIIFLVCFAYAFPLLVEPSMSMCDHCQVNWHCTMARINNPWM